MYIGIRLNGRVLHFDGDKAYLDNEEIKDDEWTAEFNKEDARKMIDNCAKWAHETCGLKIDDPELKILSLEGFN